MRQRGWRSYDTSLHHCSTRSLTEYVVLVWAGTRDINTRRVHCFLFSVEQKKKYIHLETMLKSWQSLYAYHATELKHVKRELIGQVRLNMPHNIRSKYSVIFRVLYVLYFMNQSKRWYSAQCESNGRYAINNLLVWKLVAQSELCYWIMKCCWLGFGRRTTRFWSPRSTAETPRGSSKVYDNIRIMEGFYVNLKYKYQYGSSR